MNNKTLREQATGTRGIHSMREAMRLVDAARIGMPRPSRGQAPQFTVPAPAKQAVKPTVDELAFDHDTCFV